MPGITRSEAALGWRPSALVVFGVVIERLPSLTASRTGALLGAGRRGGIPEGRLDLARPLPSQRPRVLAMMLRWISEVPP
jgi:hypothetical protein